MIDCKAIPRPDFVADRSAADCEKLLLDHLGHCRATLERIGRQAHLSPEDIEDLISVSLMKLMANQYGILRAFSGNCRFTSFLDSVLRNLLRDFRNSLWGKWRPSESARKVGRLAVEYERLTHRDGLSHHEAVFILRDRWTDGDPQLLERLPHMLPHRLMRQHEKLDDLPDPAASDSFADCELGRCQERLGEMLRQVAAALGQLPDCDRLLLARHFVEGLSLAEIARQYRLDQRRLYRQREGCLRSLRQILNAGGITWNQVESLLGAAIDELELGELLDVGRRDSGLGVSLKIDGSRRARRKPRTGSRI